AKAPLASTNSRVWCCLLSPTTTRGSSGTMLAWLTWVAIRPPRRPPACAVTSHSSRSSQANRVEAAVSSIYRKPPNGMEVRAFILPEEHGLGHQPEIEAQCHAFRESARSGATPRVLAPPKNEAEQVGEAQFPEGPHAAVDR